MRKVFEPVTDTVKENAKEMVEACKETTKSKKLKGGNTNETISEIGNSSKYAIIFELHLVELLGELTTSKYTSDFRLRETLFQKKSL